MKRNSISDSLRESKLDLSISWKLFRANWRPFVGTELFALIALVIILIVISILFSGFIVFGRNGDLKEVPRSLFSLSFIRIVLIVIIFYTFLTSQFGLANDVILSGNMFTEFKSSFYYYRKHWFSYTILTLLTSWGQILFDQRTLFPIIRLLNRFTQSPLGNLNPNLRPVPNFSIVNVVLIDLISILIHFLFFILFISALPSVTSQKNLWKGIKENFIIVRSQFGRLLATWSLFFVIFIIPPVIIDIISLNLNVYVTDPSLTLLLNITTLFVHLVAILIGTPIMALTATRLYSQLYLENILTKKRKFMNYHE
jgi:hypothetical protein